MTTLLLIFIPFAVIAGVVAYVIWAERQMTHYRKERDDLWDRWQEALTNYEERDEVAYAFKVAYNDLRNRHKPIYAQVVSELGYDPLPSPEEYERILKMQELEMRMANLGPHRWSLNKIDPVEALNCTIENLQAAGVIKAADTLSKKLPKS